ncbi:MAG: hypothetical protein PUB66_05720 [Oscillospiraceae bacterium]|nr:hypothetical protein [Oscillospiraceae bacterium]
MTTINFDIKIKAMENDVRLYEIAQQLEISESAFNRRMRKELSQADRERFLRAIEEIVSERNRV